MTHPSPIVARPATSADSRSSCGRRGRRRVAAMLKVVLLAMAAATAGTSAGAATSPDFAAVRAAHRPSDVQVLDRHGEPLASVRVDASARRGAWTALDDVSPALRTALVAGEDRRFWSHGGVDWIALAAAAWGRERGGASTLTMQLAALLDERLARPAGGRGVGDKLGQIAAARALDARWRKRDILEAYLNVVPLRGELIGITAAARQLFGKHPSGLDEAESALLVALLRAPNATPPRVAERGCGVLRAIAHMASAQMTSTATGGRPAPPPDCSALDLLAGVAFARRPGGDGTPALAPHLARRVVAARATSTPTAAGGAPADEAALRTTLDASLQRIALAQLRQQLAELQGHEVDDGAVLVLDNASGEVLAWVGSGGAGAAGEVDAVLARRQPGSTLKPFIYALAFERRLLTPASLLDDAPAQYVDRGAGGSSGGAWSPRNYNQRHVGWVSVRSALGASLNVPAVKAAALVGNDALFERLTALGLQPSRHAGHHGRALALGSADTSLLALTNAYRTLANGGIASAPRWLPGDEAAASMRRVVAADAGSRQRVVAADAGSRYRVVAADAAWLVADILADNGARARSFGLDSALATRGFAAVKTGTSKDMRDNWCIGFSDRYTVGVWVGNAHGGPMHAVSGTSGAAPVWHALMAQLHAASPSRPPPPPPGLLRRAVHFEGVAEAARDEWFIAGTELASVRAALRSSREPGHAPRFGIEHPRDGAIFAIDPDMPPSLQRIVFSGAAGNWLLDGKPIGSGARIAWAPWPGRHRLELRGRDGTLRHGISFEVRGATPVRRTARGGG